MLDKLRDEALEMLANTAEFTLSTSGPAGIQAAVSPCRTLEGRVYLLLPDTSDHLFNLEHESAVVLTTDNWQVYGKGQIVDDQHHPFMDERSLWSAVVEVTPVKMHICPCGPEGGSTTIDFSPTGTSS